MQSRAESILRAREVGCEAPDDAEPYKHRYTAADMLQQASCSSTDATSETEDTADFGAWCKLERGLQLLETDLLAEGQAALEAGLAHAWPKEGPAECCAIQLQAHNAMAGLWCERLEHQRALQHLHDAVKLYHSYKQQQRADASDTTDHDKQAAHDLTQQATCEQPDQQQAQQDDLVQQHTSSLQQLQIQEPAAAEAASATGGSGSWQMQLVSSEQVERDHTTSLLYMAQVYGHIGDKLQSASYCAATLNRQLKQGDAFDLNEWVQNCLQLSGCFLDCNAFALSQHCCSAVELLLVQRHTQRQQEQQQEQQGHSLDTAPCGAQDKEQQQQQQPEPAQEAQQQSSPGHDQQERKDQAGKQQQQQQLEHNKGLAGQQQQQQQQDAKAAGAGGPSEPLLAALSMLEADVAANVCLAFAKLHLYRLVASHEAAVEGKQVPFGFSSAADVPAVLCFDALPGLAPLSSLAWGCDALVSSADAALMLFKAALPWFRRALEYYQLDGWVTEHCNILFEMSNLHRCLAGFEPDPHKRCVMHRSRAKLLQPLEGQLSPTHYPGLSRSISLELGNIFREIADIKAAAGREPDKVAAAMRSAVGHYRLFVDSFRDESSGQLPDKVEPEMQQHYLSGLFSMARMLQGMNGSTRATNAETARQQVMDLEEAVLLLNALVKFVKANSVVEWEQQAGMAQELASLLQEKVGLCLRSVQAAFVA